MSQMINENQVNLMEFIDVFKKENALDAEIIQRVLDGLDQEERSTAKAIRIFLENHEQALKEGEVREVIKELNDKEIIDAVIKCHNSEIKLIASQIRFERAKKRYRVEQQRLKLIIEEKEDLPPDLDWDINIHELLLVKNDKDKEEVAYQNIIEFARSMVYGTLKFPFHLIRDGILPEEISPFIEQVKHNINAKAFLKDLAEFLLEKEGEGHQQLIRLFENVNLAKEFAKDEGEAPPVRFLAELIVEHLKDKKLPK